MKKDLTRRPTISCEVRPPHQMRHIHIWTETHSSQIIHNCRAHSSRTVPFVLRKLWLTKPSSIHELPQLYVIYTAYAISSGILESSFKSSKLRPCRSLFAETWQKRAGRSLFAETRQKRPTSFHFELWRLLSKMSLERAYSAHTKQRNYKSRDSFVTNHSHAARDFHVLRGNERECVGGRERDQENATKKRTHAQREMHCESIYMYICI